MNECMWTGPLHCPSSQVNFYWTRWLPVPERISSAVRPDVVLDIQPLDISRGYHSLHVKNLLSLLLTLTMTLTLTTAITLNWYISRKFVKVIAVVAGRDIQGINGKRGYVLILPTYRWHGAVSVNAFSIPFYPIPNGSFLFPFPIPGLA